MIFDTHAHYDDEAFNIDRIELLDRLPNLGVEFVVNVSAGIETVDQTIQLMDRYDYIYGTVGIHPSDSMHLNDDKLQVLKEKAKHPKCVAIGEIGLDYYWDTPEREIQKLWFEKQMEMAKELKLPTVIHSRDAANDTYQMIKASNLEQVGGIIHCFSYGVEQARQYLDLGFYLGIGGVITFTNGKKLKEVVEFAPLEQLVLETDCPYLAPVPYRGKRNSSINLTYVAKEIARIKEVDYETVVNITNKNAKNIYRMAQV